jgi:hypothetical protein
MWVTGTGSDVWKRIAAPMIGGRGQKALINCAGHSAASDTFVGPFDRLVTGVDSLPAAEQPVCWFLADAALLDVEGP